jgi:hypothetical protein
MAGELSAHAAMIEAGFRKPTRSRKQSALDHLHHWWDRATADERKTFLAAVTRVEAGFRKRQQRPKLTPVERVLRAFYRLSVEDRALFRADIQ